MTKQIESGVLHVHSENSRKDSVAKVADLFARAKELGATAIALTDHGTLTGVEEAKIAAKENGIKYIPGVEAYYEFTDSDIKQRMHLILMAKDLVGFNAISLAVTASNGNLDNMGFPIMNAEILKKYFGKGSIGHNHVVATSACMNGVIASIFFSNESVSKEIKKLEEKLSEYYDPASPLYAQSKEEIEKINTRLIELATLIPVTEKIAKRAFAKKEKGLRAFEGTAEYEAKLAELNAEKEESQNAVIELQKLKDERTALKLNLKNPTANCKLFENDIPKRNACNERIEVLKKDIMSDEELHDKAVNVTNWFVETFGKENFFCELQYHGINKEKEVMPKIVAIADELGLNIVAANDAHMTTGTKDNIKARQLIRSLRFNKWEEMFDGDTELYIKTDEELVSALSKIIPTAIAKKAVDNVKLIVDMCNVEFINEHHYPKFNADGENAVERLRRLSYEGIDWRYPNKNDWTETHKERLEYELRIITELGFCDYLCIVEDFLRYGRLLGKIDLTDSRYLNDPYNFDLLEELAKDKVGLGIGPGRGSAVGSLVCYLIGITGIDPMKYDLLFERFLNTERVSMPDIDSDFKSDIRDKVLDYVKYKYGEEAVCCIMTRDTQAAKGSVRNAARILGSEKFDDTKAFLSLGDSIAKEIGNDLGVTLADAEERVTAKFGSNADAMEIYANAKLLEGTFTNIGMHAAGVIIADNGDVKQYVPLMYNPDKEQWMTQCEKDPCEALGLLKMDFLGLRNLGIITETLKMIKKNYGKSIDIEKVPMEKEVFSKIFATGNTNSVFQFESGGMKKMLIQFKPETIDDVILLVAAYRPGPMQYLNDIIDVKHGRKSPDYVIPEMETILGNTYGSPVYQEQIMQIFNKFAGFSLGESDIIRRYMSKKKTDKFMAYKDKFIDGLCANGADRTKAENFWTQLVEFSKYAFNKSHATAYAFVAYYTAYLKCFYPKEYLASVMNDTEHEKLGGLIADCKGFGIKMYGADINNSDIICSSKNGGVVMGLEPIKSVSSSAEMIVKERLNGKFKSFSDFMLRTSCKKDVAESLIYAGAFDAFTKNRQALVDVVPDYCALIKKIKEKRDIINALEGSTVEKEIARCERAKEAYKTLLANMEDISINSNADEDLMTRLNNEKEMVGAFISAHPLDAYGTPKSFNCTEISNLESSYSVTVMGLITDFRVVARKSDGAKLAFFKLEDQTGIVDVNCFTSAYEEFHDLLGEDKVVQIIGSCVSGIDNITDEETLKINLKKVRALQAQLGTIVIEANSPMDWQDNVRNTIKVFRDKSGLNLVVYDKMSGTFRETGIRVNKQILHSSLNVRLM